MEKRREFIMILASFGVLSLQQLVVLVLVLSTNHLYVFISFLILQNVSLQLS